MPPRSRNATPLLLLLLLLVLLAAIPAGCVAQAPANMEWATPVAADGPGESSEIQQVLDAYAQSLVDKNRDRFLSTLDPASPEFYAYQLELFSRLAAVPFSQYRVELNSQTDTGPGTARAKVSIAYTLTESFPDLPDAERAAFTLVKRDDGWKLSADVTAEAMGRPRGAGLEDFGPVEVLTGQHAIVLFHPGNQAVAASVRDNIDAAYPGLAAAVPGTSLPRVPVKVFDSPAQINQAFPGQWQEWTGGAARQLGETEGQGGEIIIEATQYGAAGYEDYNRKMVAHELTHVALFSRTGDRTPSFLVEGLADFVAGEEPAALLKDRLQRGQPVSPALGDLYQPGGFGVLLSAEAAQLAYEQADTAVAYLIRHYGNESVLSLIREFKRRQDEEIDQRQLVDEVFRSVLGAGWDEFEQQWRQWVVENY